MPKILWKMRIIRKKYPKGISRALHEAIYEAYSELNRRAYLQILSTAPKSKTPSQRFPSGFVSSHIKLVTKKRPPYVYQEVDVPGKSVRGSRARRAWLIIKALHEGWKVLPFERKPTRRKALGIPVFPGARVSPRPGRTKIARAKAVQRSQITLNPWITKVWKSLGPSFEAILKERLAVKNRKKRKREEVPR